MKINIELEIEPSEVELTTELLNVLRQLTDHVRVTKQGGEAATMQTSAVEPRAAPRPAGALANGPPGFSADNTAKAAPVPSPSTAIVQAPVPPAPAPAPPPAAPPAAAPAPPVVERARILDALRQMLRMLEDPDKLPEVASSIDRLLTQGMLGSPEEALSTLMEAFCDLVFDPEHVKEGLSVAPYMNLLLKLPDAPWPFKTKMRDQLIPRVLKHLTAKRPVAVDRTEFFAHAEAFAALVQLEFVSIPGAVQTIITLLKKPENRCAAVTMLGKTVEMCYLQLGQRCNPADLAKLQAALGAVSEPTFAYDKEYICEFMGWSQAPSVVAPAQ